MNGFHIDSGKSWGPGNKPWQSFYYCDLCSNEITLQEKCALDQINATNKSLAIQERQTKTWMRANIIWALVLVIAFITLLFWDKILNCLK